MLFGETVAAYFENHTEHTDTLRGQNADVWCVKAGGTYTNHHTSRLTNYWPQNPIKLIPSNPTLGIFAGLQIRILDPRYSQTI
jgi:hypothetical protein